MILIILGGVFLLIFSFMFMCSSGSRIDETGGLGGPLPAGTFMLTLINEEGYDPISNLKTKKDQGAFYYSHKQVFAPEGVAKIGLVLKRLSDITEIPFKDEKYIRDGLELEVECAYSVRYNHEDDVKILLFRVERLFENLVELSIFIEGRDG